MAPLIFINNVRAFYRDTGDGGERKLHFIWSYNKVPMKGRIGQDENSTIKGCTIHLMTKIIEQGREERLCILVN